MFKKKFNDVETLFITQYNTQETIKLIIYDIQNIIIIIKKNSRVYTDNHLVVYIIVVVVRQRKFYKWKKGTLERAESWAEENS